MKDVLLVLLALSTVALAAALIRRRHRIPATRRIAFPFAGDALSRPALEAALRLARSEHAVLVPAFLARVPMAMSLGAPIPRECENAVPLLEAVEHEAAPYGVPVDARIERGRTYRHALRELLAHERFDRVVVAAGDGFDPADIAWLLEHADGEILILRPAAEARIVSVA